MKSKEIRKFLSELSDEDFRYLEIQMSLANDGRKLIAKFNLTKERFCDLLKIELSEYQDFINGAFEYDVQKMALMHCAWVKLRNEEVNRESKNEAENSLTGIAK